MAEAVTLENWVFDPDANYGTDEFVGPNMTLEQAKRKCLEDMSHIPESHRDRMWYFMGTNHDGRTVVAAHYYGNPKWKPTGLGEKWSWWKPEDV